MTSTTPVTTTAPDLASYRAAHTALRRAPHRIAAAARTLDPADRRRVTALARYWRGYAGEVLIHHTSEDDVFFPALVREAPMAAALIERTDDDHHRLDELMATTSEAVADLVAGRAGAASAVADSAGALAELMDVHLDFEDADILPLFERHVTAERYAELEDEIFEMLGVTSQAMFTIPFVAAALTPEARDHVLAGAPRPVRILYRLCRGRHARLEASAFGTEPVAVTP